MLFLGKKERIPWSNAWSIWFLFVAFYLLLCFWSFNFWDSLVRVIPWVIAPLAVILLRREEEELSVFYSKIATIVSFFILPFLLLTLLEIIGLYFSEEYNHLATYQFRYTFGNRNQFCETIALLVPLLFVGVQFSQIKWKKFLYYSVIVFIYLTALVLRNRAVILVLFGVYPVFLALLYLQKLNVRKRKLANIALIIFVFLGTVIVISPLRKDIPVLKNLLETGYGSGNERIQIWKNSLDLWKEKPAFGQGSGDWKIEILKTPLELTKANESTVFYQRAHNDFIQVLVENGVLGLLLFIAFFVVGLMLLFRSEIEIRTKIALAAGVIGYIFISNFSFPIIVVR
jgi:O-antigen ligase